MRDNPFHDFWQLVTGQTGDLLALGDWRWLLVIFYVSLLAAGVVIALVNLSRDREQRTLTHVAIFGMRYVIGSLWFVSSLWKLPLPVSGGFKSWLGNTVTGSAFQFHSDIMSVFAAHIALIQPFIYLTETAIAVSLILGLFVRASGIVGALFILNLWIGLYNFEGEWPWNYIAMAFGLGMFAAAHAGRSLGLDAIIARHAQPAYGHLDNLPRLARALG